MMEQWNPAYTEKPKKYPLSVFMKRFQTITTWVGLVGIVVFFALANAYADLSEIASAWIGLFGLAMCIILGMAIGLSIVRGMYGRAIERMEIATMNAERVWQAQAAYGYDPRYAQPTQHHHV